MSDSAFRQRASGRRRSAPSPEQGASTSTRSTLPSGHGGLVPSATMTSAAAPWPPARDSASLTRAARCGWSSAATRLARGAAIVARPCSRRDLPPGPAHRSSQRSPPSASASASGVGVGVGVGVGGRGCQRSAGQRDGGQLAGLVLDGGLAGGDQIGRVAGVEGEGVGGPAAGLGVGRHHLVAVRAAGEGGHGDLGARVARGQGGLELGVGRIAEGGPVGADDPPGVAAADGEVAVGVGRRVGRDDRQPGVQVSGRHPAQDGVDVAGDARADHLLGQVDRGGHGGVGPDPGGEELVRAEPEDLADRRVELVQRAVAAGREHGVVGALAAQRAVGELGREGGVAAGDVAVGQQLGQQQVRVCLAVLHRREDLVGGAARVAGPAGDVAVGRAGVAGRARPGRAGRGGGGDAGRRPRQPSPRVMAASACRPRAQSAAGMRRLPCGWTSPSRTATVPVPT